MQKSLNNSETILLKFKSCKLKSKTCKLASAELKVFLLQYQSLQCLFCIRSSDLLLYKWLWKYKIKYSLQWYIQYCCLKVVRFNEEIACPHSHSTCVKMTLHDIMHFKNHADAVHDIYLWWWLTEYISDLNERVIIIIEYWQMFKYWVQELIFKSHLIYELSCQNIWLHQLHYYKKDYYLKILLLLISGSLKCEKENMSDREKCKYCEADLFKVVCSCLAKAYKLQWNIFKYFTICNVIFNSVSKLL